MMKNPIRYLLPLFLLYSVVSCKPSDEQVATAVKESLSATTGLAPVNAEVSDGVVTLTGEVENEELKSLASSTLSGIKGVKNIVNNVTVKPQGPSPAELQRMEDDALLAKVKTNFEQYKVSGITATVNNGVVTLTGDVTRANLQQVMQAAMESGAAKVENQMTIK